MAFKLFEPLFHQIDHMTEVFIQDTVHKSIEALLPVMTTGLTLTFITYGLLVMRGAIDMSLMDFLNRSVRTGIIISIIASNGLYQDKVAKTIQDLPDNLATALLPDTDESTKSANIIDAAAGTGFSKAGEAFEKSGFFAENGFVYALLGIIILLTTGLLTAIGGTYLLLSKLALSLLIGLAPFFIAALLYQPLHRFFDLWAAQVFNYIILVVLFSAIFGLMMTIFSSYMTDLTFDGDLNIGYSIGGSVILSCAMIMILQQLPTISAGLSSGFSITLNSIPGSTLLSKTVKGSMNVLSSAANKYYQNWRDMSGGFQSPSWAQSSTANQLSSYNKGYANKSPQTSSTNLPLLSQEDHKL